MYQGHQYPWVILMDDLEIKAVTPVWCRWTFWKYWFYLNAKELFQKNLLNPSVKILDQKEGKWFSKDYTFFRSKALDFVESIFCFEISSQNFKILFWLNPKMMENVKLCFVNT